MSEQTKRRWISGVTLGVFLVLIVLATVLLWDTLTEAVADPVAFREKMEGYGFLGQCIFTLLMAAQVVLAVIPGHPFEIAGGYCFGIFGGILLTSIGAALGSAIAFFLARIFGAKTVKSFYSEEKLQKVSFLKANERQTILTLIVFLIPGVPKDMLAYFMGLTEMRFGTFMLVSFVGRLPGIAVAVLGGAAVQSQSPVVIVIFIVLFLAVLGASLLLYKKKFAKKADTNDTHVEENN